MELDWQALVIGAVLSIPLSILANLITPSRRALFQQLGLKADAFRAASNALPLALAVRTLTLPHYAAVRAITQTARALFFAIIAAYMILRANAVGPEWPIYLAVAWELGKITVVAAAFVTFADIIEYELIARDPLKEIRRRRAQLDILRWPAADVLSAFEIELRPDDSYSLFGYEPRFTARRYSDASQATAD